MSDKPRYLALYDLNKEKERKQRELFEKVNMEEGVTFQPKTFRSNSALGGSGRASPSKDAKKRHANEQPDKKRQ
jgi:hypothetical protein